MSTRIVASALCALALVVASSRLRAQAAPAPSIAFRTPGLAARYPVLWRCVAPPAGWIQHDVTPGRVREFWWCPPSTRSCGNGTAPPDEYDEFRTLAGADDEVLELIARRRTTQGLAVTVSLQPWTGGYSLDFERGNERVSLSSTTGFEWRDVRLETQPRHVDADVQRWFDAELAAWLRSEHALRDEGIALMERLRRVVNDSIAGHQLSTCDHPNAPGRYRYVQTSNGEGGFDTCARRRLTSAEEGALRADANRDIDARIAFLRANGGAMYRALMETVPFDRCWTPLPRH